MTSAEPRPAPAGADGSRGNRYLSLDEKRGPRVREMFSRIAARYDLLNDLMSGGLHRRWKRRAAGLALEAGGTRVLDLCCGTGDITFRLHAAAGGRARVVGADFTLPMLAVARRRKAAEGGAADFVQGDALGLPFRSGAFDAVTIGYGLRNVADLATALAEIGRVLRPGGRLVVLDFGKPESAVLRRLYLLYLRAVMPVVGWLFHGDADTYAYIPESLERYPAQRGVLALMREAGFVNVAFEDLMLGTMAFHTGERPEPAGS